LQKIFGHFEGLAETCVPFERESVAPARKMFYTPRTHPSRPDRPETDAMSETDLPAVIAARRPADGARLFLTETTTWAERIEAAEVIEDAAHGDLRLLEARWSAKGLTDIALAPLAPAADPRRLRQGAGAAA
jgi:hypothetical protein